MAASSAVSEIMKYIRPCANLQAAAHLPQLLVALHAGLGLAQVPHDLRIDAARDVEVGVGIVAQLGDAPAHAEGVALGMQQRHLARASAARIRCSGGAM